MVVGQGQITSQGRLHVSSIVTVMITVVHRETASQRTGANSRFLLSLLLFSIHTKTQSKALHRKTLNWRLAGKLHTNCAVEANTNRVS